LRILQGGPSTCCCDDAQGGGVARKTRALPNDQIFVENLSGHQERSQ
jgi:hypothetical protein